MKTRYRAENRLFRKPLLVLQVGEVKKVGTYVGSHDLDTLPPPNWDENKTYIQWRDATVEDLQMIEGD